jgi:hypothetical protein
MEVVSRNTIRELTDGSNKPTTTTDRRILVVNNRRALITDINIERRTVTLQWLDILRNSIDEECPEDASLTLSFYDFAFNFVPGFCITTHMAQGETIREHYGILEWETMVTKPKMAYVALTRASDPVFIHIIKNSWYMDPWCAHNEKTTVEGGFTIHALK